MGQACWVETIEIRYDYDTWYRGRLGTHAHHTLAGLDSSAMYDEDAANFGMVLVNRTYNYVHELLVSILTAETFESQVFHGVD